MDLLKHSPGINNVLERLRKHEELSLTVYPDRDKWAIGYGHQCKADHPPITLQEAEEFLEEDVYNADARFVKWKRHNCPRLDTVRSGVCVELIYWVGFGGFQAFTEMIKALRHDDHKLAALELYNSNLGKDPELRGRAKTLAVLMWEGYC